MTCKHQPPQNPSHSTVPMYEQGNAHCVRISFPLSWYHPPKLNLPKYKRFVHLHIAKLKSDFSTNGNYFVPNNHILKASFDGISSMWTFLWICCRHFSFQKHLTEIPFYTSKKICRHSLMRKWNEHKQKLTNRMSDVKSAFVFPFSIEMEKLMEIASQKLTVLWTMRKNL